MKVLKKLKIVFSLCICLSACQNDRKSNQAQYNHSINSDTSSKQVFSLEAADDSWMLPKVQFSNERGNGGKIIICNENAQDEKIELLDYFEARQKNISIDFENSNSVAEMLEVAVRRLNRFDNLRANIYKKEFSTFIERSEFLIDTELRDVPDSFENSFPRNCNIRQAVINRKPNFPEESNKQFLISKYLWDKMNNLTKSGLILHEIIYAEASANGQQNSIKSRYFNSRLSSGSWKKMSLKDYFNLLQYSSLPIFEYHFRDGDTKTDWLASGHLNGDPTYISQYCKYRGYKLPSPSEFLASQSKLIHSPICSLLTRTRFPSSGIPNLATGYATSSVFKIEKRQGATEQKLSAEVFNCTSGGGISKVEFENLITANFDIVCSKNY